MAAKSAKKPKVSGAEWRAAAGHVSIGLTLPPDQSQALHVLAAQLGVGSRAALARALVRWAVSTAQKEGAEKIRKIIADSLDSQESRE